MKIARNLAIALVLLLVAFLVLAPRDTTSILATAATIQVGDSSNRVRSVLGQPSESIAVSSGNPALGGATERWSYASTLDFLDWHPRQLPRIASLKFHFTDMNDVAVYFDSTGRVMRVQIPNR